MTFALSLKRLRKSKGLTQKELAQKTGISLHSIAGYENGRRSPNSVAMVKLETFFKVKGSYLLGNSENEEMRVCTDCIKEREDSMTSWANFKLDYHERMYGENARLWQESEGDRGLFHSLYVSISEAIKAVQGVENKSVQVALNQFIRNKYDEMEAIHNFYAE